MCSNPASWQQSYPCLIAAAHAHQWSLFSSVLCLFDERGAGKGSCLYFALNCPPDCACLCTVWGTMVQWWICILKQKGTTFTFELWEFIVDAIFQALTKCCISVRIILICTKNPISNDIKKCEEAPANHNTHTDTTLYEMHTNVISLSWSLHADGRLIVNVRVNVI